ncbi:CIA30 family protein [Methylibium sp.]|nr:CIA30 family protein [Methylibium sp.]MBA3591763.1 CIA30 family protein [Methylibium sp.]
MPKLLFDFDFAEARAVEAWHAIDDRVMGGLSLSRLQRPDAGCRMPDFKA